jgi:hypothetical protein
VRFEARHIGSGVWGVYDNGALSWLATDLGEAEARRRAMDLDVVFDQDRQRRPEHRRQVDPPVPVEAATWVATGELDYWVRERGEWWGRVRGADGYLTWIRAVDLRRPQPGGRE